MKAWIAVLAFAVASSLLIVVMFYAVLFTFGILFGLQPSRILTADIFLEVFVGILIPSFILKSLHSFVSSIPKKIWRAPVSKYGAFAAAVTLLIFLNFEAISMNFWPPVTYEYDLESGVHRSESDSHSIYWLDNERIVFSASPLTNAETGKVGENTLFVWSAGEEKQSIIVYPGVDLSQSRATDAQRLEKDLWSGAYCASHGLVNVSLGYVRAPGTDDLMVIEKLGPPFELKRRIRSSLEYQGKPIPKPAGGTRLFNRHECSRTYQSNMINRKWVPLKAAHGYLDLGPLDAFNGTVTPALLLRDENKKEIKLPIPRNDIKYVRYLDFIDAYLVYGHETRANTETFKNDECIPFWLLFPNGEAKKHCLPPGPWSNSSLLPIVTIKGIFFVNKWSKGHEGLYALIGNSTKKVIAGALSRPETSPDGCRIAFHSSYTPFSLDLFPSKTKDTKIGIINLCLTNH